jgi:6-phosphogluconolactonase
LFPGSPILDGTAEGKGDWARAVFVPALDTWRLTLTPAVIQAARAVLLLVAGADKRPALARAFGDDAAHVSAAPVTLVHAAAGDVAWFVDRAALFG